MGLEMETPQPVEVQLTQSGAEEGAVQRQVPKTKKKKVDPGEFSDILLKHGVSNCYGVPDSVLKEWLSYIDDNNSGSLISDTVVANEGLAVSMGVGYHLATNKVPLVYLQNSGFGNMLNPLLSIVQVYKIPMLFVVGWRGEYGIGDEPQHNLMGQIQESLINAMHMKYGILDSNTKDVDKLIANGINYVKTHNEPYFLLVKKGTFSKWKTTTTATTSESNISFEHNIEENELVLDQKNKPGRGDLKRYDALSEIVSKLGGGNENDSNLKFCKFFTTTGYTSRELYDIRENYYNGEHSNDFYMVGGMGHCSSVALSASLNVNNKNTNVVCVDGDGAMLMHMGGMSTIGLNNRINKLNNFIHIVINNGCHESTGKQELHHDVDFVKLAQAVGFKNEDTYRVNNKNELDTLLNKIKNDKFVIGKQKESKCGIFIEIVAQAGTIENLRRPKHNYVEQKCDFIKQIEKQQEKENSKLL